MLEILDVGTEQTPKEVMKNRVKDVEVKVPEAGSDGWGREKEK